MAGWGEHTHTRPKVQKRPAARLGWLSKLWHSRSLNVPSLFSLDPPRLLLSKQSFLGSTLRDRLA